MKANELMQGDWVKTKYGNFARVAECYQDGSIFTQAGEYKEELFDVGEFEEVPLTTEILEKNGFVNSDLPFEQSWQQYGLSIYGTTGSYHINCGINVSMDVSNIHQLQHALRLCGIEKEIEL